MTWTAPPTVATGDIYTAAMFNTYTRDNMNHLRVLLGNADPGGINKALYSTGASTATWGLLPSAAMLEQKVNQVSPVHTTFAAALALGSGFYIIENSPGGVVDGPVGAVVNWYLIQNRYYNYSVDHRIQMAMGLVNDNYCYIRWIINGSPSSWFKLWNTNNDGSGSGLDADSLDNRNAGNGNGDIPINNAILSTGLNADKVDSLDAGNGTGLIPISNGTLNTNLNADLLDTKNSGNATGNIPINNTTLNVDLNADQLDSKQSGNANGNIPISNGTLNDNLNAALLSGLLSGNASGRVPISNGTVNTNLNADMVDGAHAGNASGNVPISNGTVNTNLNADMVDGLHAAAFSLVGVQGTYSGDGSNARQITLGFVPKLVIITSESKPALAVIHSSVASTGVGFAASSIGGPLTNNNLHASDGFVVGGSVAGGYTNESGFTYRYTALR